jgi:PncC family amidohydrolase
MIHIPARSDDPCLTVSVAESCTGGLLALRLVETPGSGEWFKGGVVAYAAEVKHQLLDVDGPVISREAAMGMARAVRELLGADIGVATTGVAGPETQEDQEVGTVFVGLSLLTATEAILLDLHGSPAEIRSAAADHAYGLVRRARSGITDIASIR